MDAEQIIQIFAPIMDYLMYALLYRMIAFAKSHRELGKTIYKIEGGQVMKLSEACNFIVDCPHSTANNEGEGYPLIRTPNIGKGRLILDEVHRVSEKRLYIEKSERNTTG